MASATRPRTSELTFEDAIEVLSREERFMGTVSAMNSLLVKKGIYTTAEFQAVFSDWAAAHLDKPARDRAGKS